MRINEINKQMLVSQYGNAEKLTRPSGVSNTVESRSDNVVLSPEAKGWMDALKAAMDSEPVNMQKVGDISARIAKGTYSVSAREVAESILKNQD